jgi:hypothetical protein
MRPVNEHLLNASSSTPVATNRALFPFYLRYDRRGGAIFFFARGIGGHSCGLWLWRRRATSTLCTAPFASMASRSTRWLPQKLFLLRLGNDRCWVRYGLRLWDGHEVVIEEIVGRSGLREFVDGWVYTVIGGSL